MFLMIGETNSSEVRTITNYVNELNLMIKNTPRDCEECVRNYHEGILKKLDSEEIIKIPSPFHRNLHQNMWMIGYAIYNNQYNLDESNLEFITESEQRKKFDVWYVMKYILRKKLDNWELEQVRNASKSCEEVYHHPLDKLTRDELRI